MELKNGRDGDRGGCYCNRAPCHAEFEGRPCLVISFKASRRIEVSSAMAIPTDARLLSEKDMGLGENEEREWMISEAIAVKSI